MNFLNAFNKRKPIKKFYDLTYKFTIFTVLRRYKLRFSHTFYPILRKIKPIIKKIFGRVPKIILASTLEGKTVKCLCCGWAGKKFLTTGNRLNENCPNCGCKKRDRLMYLFLQSKFNFFYSNLKILDIGPSLHFQYQLQTFQNFNYISIDLYNKRVMLRMDATNIKFPDNNFDVIICSNVLEHIKNDIAAISEFFRVLKPGGFALILVPIGGKITFEDHSIPQEKYREYYGCSYHVRLYGLDIKDKLEYAGFKVKIENFKKRLSQNWIDKYGLDREEIFFLCLKQK